MSSVAHHTCLSVYLFILRQNLSLNLELTDLGRLAGQEAPGFLLSPLSQNWH